MYLTLLTLKDNVSSMHHKTSKITKVGENSSLFVCPLTPKNVFGVTLEDSD